MTNPSRELQTALESVKLGAEIAISFYKKDLGIETKSDKSLVTKADKAVEQAIKDHITSKFPEAKFVGEETGGNRNEKAFWIIDPIDGTRSFIRKVPTWDVLLAYCEDQEIKVGVSYFPTFNTIIYAEKNKGAYIDGTRAQVSAIDTLSKSYIGFGYIKNFNQQTMLELMQKSWNIRTMAAYTAYLVARGSMEAYIAPFNKVWDFAAYKVIIEEAGGTLTQLDGKPWNLKSIGGVLTNGHVHEEILQIINKK